MQCAFSHVQRGVKVQVTSRSPNAGSLVEHLSPLKAFSVQVPLQGLLTDPAVAFEQYFMISLEKPGIQIRRI